MTVQGGTWIDGRKATALPLPDRGLEFGDGLFETLLCRGSHPALLSYHVERLQCGLDTLGFPPVLPLVQQHLVTSLGALEDCPDRWFALRLTVSRGGGPRGYAPPLEAEPRVLITVTPLERDAREPLPPAELGEASLRWGEQPALAGIKHLNRLEQVLVAAECRRQQKDELVVCDQQGQVISVGAGNLFLVLGGELVTPELSHCGVAGTRRRAVIDRWAPALGLAVRQRPVEPAELAQATELFYCNSLQGLRPVASCGGGRWDRHPTCEALFRRSLEDLP